jgi:hypothetical protein
MHSNSRSIRGVTVDGWDMYRPVWVKLSAIFDTNPHAGETTTFTATRWTQPAKHLALLS